MASYTRQSTFADGDLITAALFNNEYNQLVSAFDNATGHKHDGTIGEGPVISVLGDAGLDTPLNKILIDTINDHIEFYIDVSETSTQQLYIADGAIVPTTDNDIDLGTNALQFKDLYLNGTANIDSLVADTIDINGGTIDGVTIGGTSAAAITGTTITGTSFVIGSATITETELEILDGATLTTTELNYVDGVTSNIQTQIDTKAPLASPNLTGIPTAPTAASNTNTTQIATTAYVQTEITELIAGAPGTLDTLNELAAAINDDANYNTTLTTALATKLPLAGGTMTGNVTYGDNVKANFGTSEDLQIYHDGSNSYITDVGTGNLIITGNLTGNVTGTVSDISNHSTSDLSEGTNLYYTDARFDTRLATKDTDDVSEGTSNLYYTDARVQNVSINNVVEDTTPQLGGTLDLNSNNITGTGNIDVTGTVTSDGLTVDGDVALNDQSVTIGTTANSYNELRFFDSTNTGGTTRLRSSAGVFEAYTSNAKRIDISSGGDISFYAGTSQALFWDASTERLGLGTTSPTTTLDVNGTIKYESLSDGTITITGFADEDNMASNSATLLPTQQSVKAYVDSQVSSAGGNGISFADNEKAQFGDGNDLQIFSNGTSSYIIEGGSGNLEIRATDIFLKSADNTKALATFDADGAASISHNGSNKLSTTSSGISVTGTATMDGLTVDSGTASTTAATFSSDLSNTWLRLESGADSGVYLGSNSGTFRLLTNTTNRLAVANNGDISFYNSAGTSQALFWDASTERLGIGTTSPSTPLELNTASFEAMKIRRGTSGTSASVITFAQGDGTSVGHVGGVSSGGLQFRTGSGSGTERARIDSSGNVGIGTSSPQNNSGRTTLTLSNSTSGGILEIFGASNTRQLLIYNDTGESRFETLSGGSEDIVFRPNGSESVRFDSSGNVGIGTDSPSSALHIANSNQATSSRGNLYIASDTAYAVDKGGQLSFGGTYVTGQDSNTFFGSIAGRKETGTSGDVTGYLSFATRDVSGNTERLRIDSSGNVGIGTSTVSRAPLEIHRPSTSDCQIHLTNTSTGTGATNGTTIYANTNSGIWHRENGYFNIATNATERMRIDSSGRVGIGTTSPIANLQISKASTDATFRIDRTGTGASALLFTCANGETSISSTKGGQDLILKTQNIEAARIDSAGRVGIGTSSPDRNLHVIGQIALENAVSASAALLISLDSSSNKIYSRTSNTTTSAHPLDFIQNSSVAMRIDSSGNVGIGTSSPQRNLHIHGSGDGTLKISNSTLGSGNLDGADLTLNTSGEFYLTNRESGSTIFETGGSERMRIDSTGNVGIGTSSPDTLLEVVGADPILTIRDTETTGALANTTLRLAESSGGDILGNYWDINLTGGTTLAFKSSVVGVVNERMRIDSSGNVGIGTTSPNADLHLRSVLPDIRLEDSDDGSEARISYNTAGNNGLIISSDEGNEVANSVIAFKVDASEKARIDSSGRLLINKTSATGSLSLESQAPSGFSVGSGFYSASTQSTIEFKDTNTTANYKVRIGSETDDLVMFAGGSKRMTIDSSGNVGIGTNDPTVASGNGLAIYDSVVPRVQLRNSTSGDASTDGAGIFMSGSDLGIENRESSNIIFYNNTEKMRIDSSGRVGIGTTSPLSPLHVQQSSDVLTSGLTITRFGANRGSFYLNSSNDTLNITRGATAAIAINSSGNVGIGTDSPSEKLHVTGNILASGNVTAYSDERLKDNIQTLQGSKVLEMRGVSYTKDGEASSGVIAQEIEKVAPELVHTAKDEMGTKSVAYGNLVGYLIEAIKDQQQQIDELKARLDNDSSK